MQSQGEEITYKKFNEPQKMHAGKWETLLSPSTSQR